MRYAAQRKINSTRGTANDGAGKESQTGTNPHDIHPDCGQRVVLCVGLEPKPPAKSAVARSCTLLWSVAAVLPCGRVADGCLVDVEKVSGAPRWGTGCGATVYCLLAATLLRAVSAYFS